MSEQWTANRKAWVAAGIGLGLVGRELYRRRREADLHGQVALVTGSSRGLGFLLARELARQGCRIVICARDDEELARAREALEREGATVLAARCDVADRREVEGLIGEINTCFGRIDLLVNNAGTIAVGPVETMTIPDFEQAMGVMFWGMVYPTLAVLPQMRERRSGRIVNITSIGGKVSVPHLLPYSSAKFAAVGFSEGLGAELARDGIQVTTIVPGLMRTGSYLNAFFKGQHEGEFTWFGLGSALPLISISAERAAREIVKAAKRGEPERILSLPANLLARFHGLFPSTTIDLLALINRLLPAATDGGGTAIERGQEVQERLHSPLLDTLTTLGRTAARRYQHTAVPTEAAIE
jgi:NAD(P)-dependent dehydrogenase (short-subunit alcohol dehydrogenase family)